MHNIIQLKHIHDTIHHLTSLHAYLTTPHLTRRSESQMHLKNQRNEETQNTFSVLGYHRCNHSPQGSIYFSCGILECVQRLQKGASVVPLTHRTIFTECRIAWYCVALDKETEINSQSTIECVEISSYTCLFIESRK